MSTPNPVKPNPVSPAAQLRQALTSNFSVGEIKVICFDLGLDYDSLPPEAGLGGRAVEIIAHFAERGQIAALVERMAADRPEIDWSALRTAAQNPAQFKAGQSIAIAAPATPAADRAMRFGMLLGALAVVLVICGFGGGLVAGQVVDVTLKPVPYSREASVSAFKKLSALGQPGQPSTGLNNVEATSLATDLLTPDAPVSDVHVRFTDNNQVILNMRAKVLGDRRVVIAYTVVSSGGTVTISPESAWLNVVEIENSKFGWAPLPASAVEPVTRFLQSLADRATRRVVVSSLDIANDDLSISATMR